MATISNKSIIESGAQAGKDYAAGLAVLGAGLVGTLRPLMLELPKGKAEPLMLAFWTAFDKGAGACAKRAKVTKSESLRIARGIDAGQVLKADAAWNVWTKAAPKSAGGKGAGGGRKARPTDGTAPADAGADATPKTAMMLMRQPMAMMCAIMAARGKELPQNVTRLAQELAAVMAGIPIEE